MNSINIGEYRNNIVSMKEMSHKPIRSCVVCKKRDEKDKLFRLAKVNQNLIYDKVQKQNSRAIYLCKDRNCLVKLKKMIENGKLKVNMKIDLNRLNEIIRELESELGE